jgi:hypothetical protein
MIVARIRPGLLGEAMPVMVDPTMLTSGSSEVVLTADAKLTCSRESLCVVNDQPVGNPKRMV